MAKARFTNSPLGNPTSAIHLLACEFADRIYFPDPRPLYVTMGAMAANMLTGVPVWLLLVGPPSCGKTTMLNSLLGIPGVHDVSSVKTVGALLPGSPRRDRQRDSHGGLLKRIGSRGCLVFKDFTTMLSMTQDNIKELMSAFREIYDGRWRRDVGTDGGRTLMWEGRLGLLGGSTETVDQQHALISEMGERMAFFRYPVSDGWGESRDSLNEEELEVSRNELRELVTVFFDALDMGWAEATARRKYLQHEWMRLATMAAVTARSRSTVYRHPYTREVELVPQPENPSRVATILGQIYLGLEVIGLEESERWPIVSKIALDSIPMIRRKAIEYIRRKTEFAVESTVSELIEVLDCCDTTARRVTEELRIYGLIEKGPGRGYLLSHWAVENMRALGPANLLR